MSKLFYGRLFAKSQAVREGWVGSNMHDPNDADSPYHKDEVQHSSSDAELVISATSKDFAACQHYPVIDLDVPVNLIPASRIGHTHLYINHPVSQEGLFEILSVLAKYGIVEDGYVNAAKHRGYCAVRLPWIHKKKEIL